MLGSTKAKKIALSALLALLIVFMPMVSQAASKLKALYIVPGKVVSLTIDDGYNKSSIKKMLTILREKKIKSTLFIIGSQLVAFPSLWKQAIEDGHEICYHSMYHKSMGSWSDEQIEQDLIRWNKTAKKVLGQEYTIPKLARLPFAEGHLSQRILKLFKSLNYKVIGWNVDTYTGAMVPKKSISNYIKNNTSKGSIILLHFNPDDEKALPNYIDWLDKNFVLMRVSDALQAQKSTPKPSPPSEPTTTQTLKPTDTPEPVKTPMPSDTPMRIPGQFQWFFTFWERLMKFAIG